MKSVLFFLWSCSLALSASGQEISREAAILFNEAVVAFKSNNLEGAVESFGKAISIEPDYQKARYNRARAYLKLKEYKKAIADLQRVVKLDPTSIPAWKYKGYAAMQIENYPMAIHSYIQALELDPAQDDLRTNKIIALMKHKDYPNAKQDLLYLMHNGKDEDIVLYNLAICELQLDNAKGASTLFGKLLDRGYKVEYVGMEQAKLFFNQKKFAEALPALDKVIASGTDKCEAYYLRGYSKLKMGDIAGADEDFEAAINLNQKHKPSIQNKAFTSFKLENYEDAVQDFTKLLELEPKDKKIRLNRGLSSLKLENYQDAYVDFSKVIELDPKLASAYFNRATAAVGLKKSDQACSDMREAAKLGHAQAFDHIRGLCGM